ncbi:hypothetical protein G7K_4924-t1 [Saitoella complicata NRRL Y-17804]|uniref:Uncharacterized protein n=1 Tax=Saitoella complicata (strain BCRC 22490 / CBS 7301 / JCM 7358 / NBRC 10748 / NRRL Y-17804) TaxID=698492 RepID=A0A0E9NLW7_SAICN|nr:hypothetical protein G7K_4924-t1 [Saitoella complicata NRRL Y-17804]
MVGKRVHDENGPVSTEAPFTTFFDAMTTRESTPLTYPSKSSFHNVHVGQHIQLLFMNSPSLYHDEAADFINETLCTDINPCDIQRYLKQIK